jgi:hypothetical protein
MVLDLVPESIPFRSSSSIVIQVVQWISDPVTSSGDISLEHYP